MDEKLLDRMLRCISPSGNESQMEAILREELGPLGYEMTTDGMGNLMVHVPGDGPRVMLAAHMDEIGLMVTSIDENGFARFAKLGGLHPEALIGKTVRFTNGVQGVLCKEEKQPLKELQLKHLYVDVGADSREAAEALIRPGDVAAPKGCLTQLQTRFCGKSLDDKLGCLVLAETVKRLKAPKNDCWFVFTVQEELGLRGAKTAAYALEPDFAVAVDVTVAGDTPNGQALPMKLGAGPAVKLRDASVICHRRIVEWLTGTAEAHKIPYQREILESGGTDAGSIHLTRAGVPSGGLSLVIRNVHTPGEVADRGDVDGAVALLTAALEDGIQ